MYSLCTRNVLVLRNSVLLVVFYCALTVRGLLVLLLCSYYSSAGVTRTHDNAHPGMIFRTDFIRNMEAKRNRKLWLRNNLVLSKSLHARFARHLHSLFIVEKTSLETRPKGMFYLALCATLVGLFCPLPE